MTPTDDDLELWAAHAGKLHAAPRGACSLAEVVAEVRRLRVLAQRSYPGLRPSLLCSAHQEPEGHYECTVCYPDLPALLREHAQVNEALREENDRLRLRLEQDAQAYAVTQAGMESQCELMDGLKQRVRELEVAHDRLRKAARLAVQRLEDRPTKRAEVAEVLREALR